MKITYKIRWHYALAWVLALGVLFKPVYAIERAFIAFTLVLSFPYCFYVYNIRGSDEKG